jgi:hypothetical protein
MNRSASAGVSASTETNAPTQSSVDFTGRWRATNVLAAFNLRLVRGVELGSASSLEISLMATALIGIIILLARGATVDVLVTAFTALLTGTLGLFAPQPQGSSRTTTP